MNNRMIKTNIIYEYSKWEVNLLLSIISPVLFYLITYEQYPDEYENILPFSYFTPTGELAINMIRNGVLWSFICTLLILLYSHYCVKKGSPLLLSRYIYWCIPLSVLSLPIMASEIKSLMIVISIAVLWAVLSAIEAAQKEYSVMDCFIYAILDFLCAIGSIHAGIAIRDELLYAILGDGCIKNSIHLILSQCK